MRKQQPTARARYLRIGGFSLIELMVSLAIGLVLAIAASMIYLYTKKSYNANTENSQMEENGRFALNLLAKYIQSAGFVMVDPTSNSPQGPIDNKISGCDFGFIDASTPTAANLACLSATPSGSLRSASIALFSETDTYNSTAPKHQGFDCVGESAIPIGTTNLVRSYFFVSHSNVQTPNGTKSMGQLACVADRTPASGVVDYQMQPLIPGIEQLAFTYLLPSNIDTKVAQAATSAASAAAASQWPAILAVEVCVLAKTIQAAGNDTGTTYTDCYGNAITALATESYRTFRTTVSLRNKTTL